MLKEKKKVKQITNTNINFLGAFLCLFVLFQSPSKVKISNVSFKKIRGTSSTKEAAKIICSKSVLRQQVLLFDIDLAYKRGGGSTTSSCDNVKPTVSSKQNPPPCTNKL